ncbi:glycosyltransferase [Pseudoroseomonas wenyumeiae]|uniref:Glycosyltransferase n=1 Tax=Teichococcus wenyumeiae TaxID=2478470 RepID=A0A3A9JML3_9PROT|nr:glycosyltransferase [Pseudoroseomonas wenyumeiae]RKK04974.1 glycosyltransferase [Pseudoroseomonas wenyumeiae]RMI26053.1 glycosyltransferase [Pseudoroseomonas wenyumeiae]
MNASAYRPVAACLPASSLLPRHAPWPRVSLHLPLRDAAPEQVRRTLDSLAALDYPALEVLVVDTQTAEPALWEAAAEHCARLGPQFRFFHLGCTPGGRAGALNFALQEAAPDTVLVGVLRAGQVVRASWLRRMVPLFRRPGLGMAQGMLAPLDARESPACHPDRLLPLDGLPLFRAEALRRAGGWDPTSLCPEAALGLTLMRHGWDSVFEPEPMGRAVPAAAREDWPSLRHRRVAGTMAALRQHVGAVLLRRDRSLTPPQRNHLLALAAPALLDALALAGAFASLACVLLALWDDASVMPTLPLLPVLSVLSLAPLLCGQASGIWSIGRAAWQGLLGGRTSGHRMETMLTGLLWAAAVAVVLARPWNAWESLVWAGLLLVQSLPGLAALASQSRPAEARHRRPAFRRHAA